MSEVARTGFLIKGTKEKSKDDVFHGHHLHQISLWTCLRIAFLASYRCISGTLRVQFGSNSGTDMLKQHATSVASCMVILAHIRRNRRHPLFPFLLIFRTEEAAGSNPARSTKIVLAVGIHVLMCLHMGIMVFVLEIFVQTV